MYSDLWLTTLIYIILTYEEDIHRLHNILFHIYKKSKLTYFILKKHSELSVHILKSSTSIEKYCIRKPFYHVFLNKMFFYAKKRYWNLSKIYVYVVRICMQLSIIFSASIHRFCKHILVHENNFIYLLNGFKNMHILCNINRQY